MTTIDYVKVNALAPPGLKLNAVIFSNKTLK
jgi:hypothetical protein